MTEGTWSPWLAAAQDALNACHRLDVEPGELEELVVRLLDTRGEALSQLAAVQAKVGALVGALENIAAKDCEWRRDYYHPAYLDGGPDCLTNGVVPGCSRCQASAALADWEGKP